MTRPVTLFTGQWADLPLEEMCRTAKDMGYEGLEIATWGQIDVHKAASDPGLCCGFQKYIKKMRTGLLGAGRSSGGPMRGRPLG